MSQLVSRILWIALPLMMVAVMSASEWPARAQMLEEPLRTPLHAVAVHWDEALHGPRPVETAVVVATPKPVQPKPTVKPTSSQVAIAKPPVVIVAKSGKVLLLGDSLMGGVGPGLRQDLPREFVIKDYHRSSTGLTNQGYYDWAAQAGVFTAQEKPQWVFIHLGGNDGQDMMLNKKWVGFGSDQWKAEYIARAKKMIENVKVAAPTAPIVWIGLPAMRPEKYERKARVIAELQEQAASEMGIAYASGYDALGLVYAKQGVGLDGKQHVMRLDDGIHYSREGGHVLARAARKLAYGLPQAAPK